MISQGRLAEACRHASAAVPTNDPEAQKLYVETLLRSGRLEEAARQLDDLATKVDPGDPEEIAYRVRLTRMAAGSKVPDVGRSLEELLRDRASRPGFATLAIAAVEDLVPLGPEAWPAAESIARKFIASQPRSGWLLGRVFVLRGQSAEGLDACRASIQSEDRSDRKGAAYVASLVASTHQVDDPLMAHADSILTEILSRDPLDVDILQSMAVLRHFQRRYDDEVSLYRKVLTRKAGSVEILNDLAWTLSEGVNQPAEALQTIDRAISIAGRAPRLLDTRGVILTRLGRLRESIADLEESVRTQPSPLVNFHLAYAYRKAGRDGDSRARIEQSLRAGLSVAQADLTERDRLETFLRP
jgi:tetratricopeptide (TPR) repeat protein